MLGYYLISVRKDKKKLRRLVHERPKKCVFYGKKFNRCSDGISGVGAWLFGNDCLVCKEKRLVYVG